MKYSKEIIKSQLKEAKKIKKSLPTKSWWEENYRNYNFCSMYTIRNHFGNWRSAMIHTFQKENNFNTRNRIQLHCSNCHTVFEKVDSQIRSNNNFCSKSCATTYNNKNKTHGTRRSKLEAWIEDQLKELYPDLEIHFNRKDAIGSELDIYFPTLKLAIELNGIFHYEPIYGEDKLNQIQENDQNKLQTCQSHGISLCIIDTSRQKYVKPKTSQKYLDTIIELIESRYTRTRT